MARKTEGATSSRVALCYALHVHTAQLPVGARLSYLVHCTRPVHTDGSHEAVVTDLAARDHAGKIPLVRPTLTITWSADA
jgi:hypothetical protein